MKKYLCLVCAIIVTFMFMGNVNAGTLELRGANTSECVKDASGNQTCNPKLVYNGVGESRKFNTIELTVFVSNATMDNNIQLSNGLYLISKSAPVNTTKNVEVNGILKPVSGKEFTLKLGTRRTIWTSGTTIDLGKYTFSSDAEPCLIVFGLKRIPYFETRNECEEVDGYFYDRNGNSVNEETYRKSCFMCQKDENNGKYYGKNGQELDSEDAFNEECGERKYCQQDGNKYYGKNGGIVSKLQYYDECENPSCIDVKSEDGNTVVYYDADGKKLENEKEYLKACFSCDDSNGVFRGIDGQIVSEIEYRKQCFLNICEALGDSYYDKDGKEVSKEEYQKSCFSCIKDEINNKFYNKDGREVTEKEYLKSCFACRKENGKYYDTTGKETTESEWNAICTPHKCEIIGDHYFNDMGKDVPKAEYEKACKNPKTGISETKMLYLYVIAGFTLFAGIVIGTKKFSKISKF